MNRYAVGDNIKFYCKLKNLTLHTLAEEIGVSWVTMSKWINGHRQITAYALYRVSQVLDVSMEKLMDDVGEDIGRLPSIQFATDTNVGIKLGTNLAQLGTDCISRQTVLDAIDDIESEVADGFGFQYEKWRKHFAELPPTEPKRGKWILNRSGAYCCSECMEPCAGYVMMKPRDKFCKMCGSRNEVTE